MLQELIIKNLAIIDNLTLTFKEGLNVLTGETGAGKSIIVDALGLALGQRASSEILRHGEEEGSVQALFDVRDIDLPQTLTSPLSEDIYQTDGSLILRRHISFQGKSKAYINDNLVSISTLAQIGSLLVDIHSQQEHQSLMNRDIQLELLDAYGGLEPIREQYRRLYSEVSELRSEIEGLEEALRFKAQRMDLLQYQIKEIQQAALKPGEEELLQQEYAILKNASRLSESVTASYETIYGADDSCLARLSKGLQRLRDLQHIDPDLSEVVELLSQAKPLLEESAQALMRLKEKYEVDPARLDRVNERLDLIDRLKKKYGGFIGGEVGVEEILLYLKRAEEELKTLESSDERLSELRERLKKKEEELMRIAKNLSEKRREVAKKIEEAMARELKEVGLEKAIFKVNLRTLDHPSKDGIDSIEFEFSANPGEPPKPISKIASGGELSRLMLCLKVILAEVDRVPVLIFDEVDAGIGGYTAEKVAQRLKRLSRKRQVLCITHLPQIASAADHHIKVEKTIKRNSVSVRIKSLTEKEREEEIARMLSGKITDASLRHARELLNAYR